MYVPNFRMLQKPTTCDFTCETIIILQLFTVLHTETCDCKCVHPNVDTHKKIADDTRTIKKKNLYLWAVVSCCCYAVSHHYHRVPFLLGCEWYVMRTYQILLVSVLSEQFLFVNLNHLNIIIISHPSSSLILTISGAGGGSTEAVCTLSFAMRLLSFQFFNGSLIITRWGLKENGWLWWKRFYYAVHTCLVSLISHSWALTKSKWKKY